MLLCALSYLFLPIAENFLFAALAGLFAVFLFFEFAMVSFLSMCTELVPGSRATMMSLFFAAAGIGRVAGAFSGGVIWNNFGMDAVCTVSAVFNVIAVLSLWLGIKKWSPEST